MAGTNNSIVIVNCNAKTALLTLLQSLHLHEATGGEVIVVDNASFDGSVEAVAEQFPRAKVLALKTNRGFAAAANRGIDQAESDIVVVCHADIITDIHALAELADQAREAEGRKAAAVVARLAGVDDVDQPFVGTLPGLMSVVAGIFDPPAGLRCRVPSLDHLADHEWARFVCVALNRNYLASVGVFDEKFFLYAADTDLCARFHTKALRVLISKTVKVTHAGSPIGKQIPSHLMRILRKDEAQYARKHLPGWQQGVVGAVGKMRGWFARQDHLGF
jgi:hypothetical protein